MFAVVLFSKTEPQSIMIIPMSHLNRMDDRDRPVVPVLHPHDTEQTAVHKKHDQEPGVQHGQPGQQFGEGGPGLQEGGMKGLISAGTGMAGQFSIYG